MASGPIIAYRKAANWNPLARRHPVGSALLYRKMTKSAGPHGGHGQNLFVDRTHGIVIAKVSVGVATRASASAGVLECRRACLRR
jgi:hypothetical protein